jgi:hypothetical protein
MKDYDDEVRELEGRTRQFKLRGVEFEAKPVMPGQHLSALADMQTGADSAHSYETVTGAIRATLLESYRERWDQVLEAEYDVPISLQTLMKIADDLVENATGRPPTQPSPSGTTDGRTSTRSTDASDSTVPPVLTPLTPARG